MEYSQDFYGDFMSYYGIEMLPVRTAPPPLPPRPGMSPLRLPPPIPFHTRPSSYAHPSPVPLPVEPFNPLPVSTATRLPVIESNVASPLSSVSTTFSGYDVVNPVSLEGRVPPFPNPFAAAYQQREYNLDLEHQEPDVVMEPQEQMMNALNRHINTANDILN